MTSVVEDPPAGDRRADTAVKTVVLAVVFAFVLLGGCVAACVGVIYSRVIDSVPYREAVALAREDPGVQQAIGVPIETGLFVSGSLQLRDDGSHAAFLIPLTGPAGSGRLSVVADKAEGDWRLETVSFQPEAGPVIELVGRDPAPRD